MAIFGPIEGTWFLSSKSDPRWNADGRALVGGLVMPVECVKKLEELEKKLGKRPKDLQWGYMKD